MSSENSPKKPVKHPFLFIILIGAFFLFVILIASSPSNPTEPVSQVSPTESESEEEISIPPIKISALQLSEEYNANKIAADQKYKDRILEVSGVINSIDKDILNTPYITLRGQEFSLFGVQCMFDKSQEDKLAKLIKGQSITITGKVSGELIGNIILRNCDF